MLRSQQPSALRPHIHRMRCCISDVWNWQKDCMESIGLSPVVTNTIISITQDPTSLTLDSLSMRHLEHWTVMYSTN